MNSIQYSGYNFPHPLPSLAESSRIVFASGLYDHAALDIQLIGFLTGANISGLHLQKQQMISGLLDEYGDLTITVGSDIKNYSKALPISIDFAKSDLTTVLPYTVSFLVFTGESFSQFFGVSSPENSWSFQEDNNKIVSATHTISAQGEKINNQDALQNAINFVTGLTGFSNVAPILTGNSAFLRSRIEKINRKTANYSITEVYVFDGSDHQETPSGVVTYDTTINFDKDGGLNAGIRGSIIGGIGGNLVHTGLFTPQNATDALIKDVGGSMSTYDSGVFSFVRRGPTSYSYETNTGQNKIDFNFSYVDVDNLDQSGNIGHKFKTTIQANKDTSNFIVTAEGELFFNSIESAINTGEYESSARFQAVDAAFSGLVPFNIAYRGWTDFQSGISDFTTGTSATLSNIVKSRSVNKDPINNRITYNYQFDTSIDYSSGQLENLKITITDKIPISLSRVVPTLAGFAAQEVTARTLGEYAISATCDENSGQLPTLKNIVDGMMQGHGTYEQSKNHVIGEQNISYNISKFY